jgi:hypothetical protein
VVVALDAVGAPDEGDLDAAAAIEGRWRIGVGRGVDLGLGTSGALDHDLYSAQADVNWAFARAASCTFALDPTIAIVSAFDTSATLLWLPLLADVYDDGRTSVTLAAKYGRIELEGVADSDLVTIVESGSLLAFGVGVRVRTWKHVALMPELSAMFPAFDGAPGDPLYVLGLGIVWE